MAGPRMNFALDLNQEPPPDHDVPVRRARVEVFLPNPIDWDQVREDVFQWEEDDDHGGQANGADNQHHEADVHVPDNTDGTNAVVNPDIQSSNTVSNVRGRRKQYSDDTKRAVYAMLLEGSVNGHLPVGLSLQVSLAMDVTLRSVQRIWREGQKGGGIDAVVSKRPRNCGRKRIGIPVESMTSIPFQDRTTLEDLARGLGMSRSTVFNRLKEGKVQRHSSAIKPFLTEENMKARVQHALNMLEPSSVPHQPVFRHMYNMVHEDEKWFYRTRKNQKFYCAPGEERPRRSCKSKNYIEKVMVLGGHARPRFNEQNECTFDGKIGIYAFVYTEAAKRKSPNRPRGTLITKAMTSVTREVIRRYMIDKLLPDIKAKWPAEGRHETIWIQQNNCRTHIPVDDPEFVAAAQADGWDIRLTCQPANSPDTNVLDLGFFAALQALFQRSGMPKTIDEIMQKVEAAYWNYPADRANRIFLTLQSCLQEILKAKGGHHYPIPHMKKAMLERLGILPKTLQCDPSIVEEAMSFLASV